MTHLQNLCSSKPPSSLFHKTWLCHKLAYLGDSISSLSTIFTRKVSSKQTVYSGKHRSNVLEFRFVPQPSSFPYFSRGKLDSNAPDDSGFPRHSIDFWAYLLAGRLRRFSPIFPTVWVWGPYFICYCIWDRSGIWDFDFLFPEIPSIWIDTLNIIDKK